MSARGLPTRSKAGQTASPPSGGGCLSGFILPPLMALAVGLLMFIFLGGMNLTPVPSTGAPSGLAPFFTAEVQYWSDDLARWAAEAGVDPNLAATVMQIESCGDPLALSPAGAQGLFQVMPDHFTAGEEAFAPETNALRGLAYLARSLQAAGGDPRLALAGYNGGIGVQSQPEWAWPDETRRYAEWGTGIYTDASQGARVSQTLLRWLASGGYNLCWQAHDRLGLP